VTLSSVSGIARHARARSSAGWLHVLAGLCLLTTTVLVVLPVVGSRTASFAFDEIVGGVPDSGATSCYPIVTGVSANTGPLSGGDVVTVAGANFTGTPIVRFGSTPATNVNVASPTSLAATAPARSAGTVDITVTNVAPTGLSGRGPTSTTSSSDRYTYGALGIVTGMSLNGGPSSGGTSVTVTVTRSPCFGSP
jgi:IPT/TIG domain